MRAKLTPAFVLEAAPPVTDAEVVYWDTMLPGFGLAVTKNGNRSYVVGYRAAGRKRRMHLKRGLTFSDAKKEALAVLGAVAKGADPLGEGPPAFEVWGRRMLYRKADLQAWALARGKPVAADAGR